MSHDSAPGVRHCIVVAVVVGTVWAQGALVAGGVERKGKTKTIHDVHRGSFSWRTAWASHFLGPPLRLSIPNCFVDLLRATHIPLKRGGASAGGTRASLCAR